MKILVTGGAGYIGSHTSIDLIEAGHEVVIVDNLINSKSEALARVEKICGQAVTFYQADIRDADALNRIFSEHKIDSVIHFAGLKAVGESTQKPLEYYDNNVNGSRILVDCMLKNQVYSLIFSSSATVYGDPASVPILESFPLSATNPYGRSKLMVEEILRDVTYANDKLSVVLLRYFNPVGAHKSGLIGEDPNGIPNNLMPFIAQVAVGKREYLSVFGDDYSTTDGTGVRDYIHVLDLARGHVQALEKLYDKPGTHVFNLGTGKGSSVLEMVKAFEAASGKAVPYKIAPRRPGDIAQCYADPTFAEQQLGFKAKRDVKEMAEDTWRWQSQNPNGYDS
ncbi:UDP-glucose 4-epimerase GalE [Catenovulum sp. 2E275]|uniref:UDP-glucose 4-epimerase GalE n=1 Tax=Catenovulum sp. 2E275 TaxID=2980497 RepID=UPI0021D04687|nr:UDP-glucose 4-epimerase GalE [Catenovulum sp. 2E275]MCU4674539.1 UDP-glucose 4-epimerase GalE [Catenovulum sp. 2E275]